MELVILLVVAAIVVYIISAAKERRPASQIRWDSAEKLSPTEDQRRTPFVRQLEVHIKNGTGFAMDYKGYSGEFRKNIVVYPTSTFYKSGYPYLYFAAFSEFHGEARTFRVDRVIKIHPAVHTGTKTTSDADQE